MNLSSSLLEKIAKYIDGLYSDLEGSSYRKKILKEIEKGRKFYYQEVEKKDLPWENASQVDIPLIPIAVDFMEPRLYSSLVGKEPIIKLKDFGKIDYHKDIEEYDNWWLNEHVKIKTIASQLCNDLLIDGTVFMLPHWKLEMRTRRDFERSEEEEIALSEEGEFIVQNYNDIIFEGARIEFIPIDHVFIPDNLEDWEEGPILRKIWPTYKELKHKSKNEIGWIEKNINDDLFAEEGKEEQTTQEKIVGAESMEEDEKLKVKIECIEAHIDWDIDGDGEEEKIIVVMAVHKKRILRIVLNLEVDFFDRRQIRRLRIFPKYGLSYGRGLPTILEQLALGVNNIFNTSINSAIVQMMPWFMYSADAGLPEKPKLRPGVGIEVVDPDKVKFPHFNSLSATTFVPFINLFIGLFEKLTLVSPGQEGEMVGKKPGSGTATATMIIKQEGEIKHTYQGKTVHDQFIELLEYLHDLYYINMPLKVEVEVLGKTIEKRQMSRNYSFALTSADHTANKYIERQEAENLAVIASQFSQIANQKPFLEDILETYGKKDVGRYINPEIKMVIDMFLNVPEFRQHVMIGMQKVQQMLTQMQTEKEAGGEK